MGSIQFPEIVVILLIALLIFGPKKLPEVGRTLGSAMRELKKAAREFTESVEHLDVREDIQAIKDNLNAVDEEVSNSPDTDECPASDYTDADVYQLANCSDTDDVSDNDKSKESE